MTNLFALILLTLTPYSSMATTTITCAEDNFTLSIEVDALESAPAQSSYVVTRDGERVAVGALDKISEGEHPSLKTWVWEFLRGETSVGVALVSSMRPQVGKHDGKSDLFIKWDNGYWAGTSVDCQIVVQ